MGLKVANAVLCDDIERKWPGYIYKARVRYPRAWMPWNRDEDELLLRLHDDMQSISLISKRLGRGKMGISLRLKKLKSKSMEENNAFPRRKVPIFTPLPKFKVWPSDIKIRCTGTKIEAMAEHWGVNIANLIFAMESLDQIHWLVFILGHGMTSFGHCSLCDIANILGYSFKVVETLQIEADEVIREGLAYYGTFGDKPK